MVQAENVQDGAVVAGQVLCYHLRMKIKNENDFLVFLISIKDDNNNIDVLKMLKQSNISELDCSAYLSMLFNQGYIKYLDTQTYHIEPSGVNAYISLKRKNISIFLNLTKGLLKFLVPFLLGLFSNDIYRLIVSFFTAD